MLKLFLWSDRRLSCTHSDPIPTPKLPKNEQKPFWDAQKWFRNHIKGCVRVKLYAELTFVVRSAIIRRNQHISIRSRCQKYRKVNTNLPRLSKPYWRTGTKIITFVNFVCDKLKLKFSKVGISPHGQVCITWRHKKDLCERYSTPLWNTIIPLKMLLP